MNVDETGWFEFEYTYSPSGPASPEEAQREAEASSKPAASAVAASASSFATQTLEDAGEIRVCMDGDKLVGEATFDTEEQSWVSVGLRPSGCWYHLLGLFVRVGSTSRFIISLQLSVSSYTNLRTLAHNRFACVLLHDTCRNCRG